MILYTPAQTRIVFLEGKNIVYFFDDKEESGRFILNDCDESLDFIMKQPRQKGKVEKNPSNIEQLYTITKKITGQVNKPHYFSKEYIFSQEFTRYYDEFGLFFPEFARLKELARIIVLVRILDAHREGNKENIKKLKLKLNDTAHWKNREAEIDTLIKSINEEYEDNRKSVFNQIYTNVHDNFSSWVKQFNMEHLIAEQTRKLNNILNQLKPLVFTSNSLEVSKIIENHFEETKNQIISEHGWSVWSENEYDIRSKMDSQRSQLAEKLSIQKRSSCKAEVNALFSPLLSHLAEKSVYDFVIDSFLNGEITILCKWLAKLEYEKAIAQISDLFPGIEKSNIEKALTIDSSALNNITNLKVNTHANFIEYYDKVQENLKQARNIIQSEKTAISEAITKGEKLEFEFENIMGSKIADESDNEPCPWVPANINHRAELGRLHFVYGGVSLAPTISTIEKNTPQGQAILNQTSRNSSTTAISARSLQNTFPTNTSFGTQNFPQAAASSAGSGRSFSGSSGSGNSNSGGNNDQRGRGSAPSGGGRRSVSPPGTWGVSRVDATRLKTVLAFQEAGILTQDGKLTPEAIKNKEPAIREGSTLSNPTVIFELTKNGSKIDDWFKYKTPRVTLQSGQEVEIHFYYNSKTDEINYTHQDYKVKNIIDATKPTISKQRFD